MSVEQTQRTMDLYFEGLDSGDFTQYFVEDVTWTTMDTSRQVVGPPAVHDLLIALHERMAEGHGSDLIVADGVACLEGDCTDGLTAIAGRLTFCLVYDVQGDRISALRFYGPATALIP
jgi:hypothetical protein